MNKIFVKPVAKTLVHHEDGTPLAEGGEVVDRCGWWLRRERDGDIVISDVNKTKSTKTKE